jgi:hypothetical protein
LKERLKPEIRVVEIDAKINDKVFAEKAIDLLDELMHKVGQKARHLKRKFSVVKSGRRWKP